MNVLDNKMLAWLTEELRSLYQGMQPAAAFILQTDLFTGLNKATIAKSANKESTLSLQYSSKYKSSSS